LLKWCAANKRAYHVVETAELDRVASSLHHEGACVLVKAREPLGLDALLSEMKRSTTKQVILALDGVANPNNLGALTRSAAHFGARAILYRPTDPEAGFSSALARVAEGGLEHVELLPMPNLAPALAKLRERGFVIAATSGRAASSLFETVLPERLLLLLGAEDRGVSKELERLAALRLQIPGTGHVESLNVSAAGAVFLAEFRRQHPTREREETASS
jgi:TrmH RNA methyltransferase